MAVGPRTEKIEQALCVKFYRALGCTTYSTSQTRRSHVALGLPDLFVCWPALGAIFVHEVKRDGGKLRPDQVKFKATWEASGGAYIWGGLEVAKQYVAKLRNVATDPWPT